MESAQMKTYVANHMQGKLRAVGGRLMIRVAYLEFQPHSFDLILGGKACAIARENIAEVGVEPGRLATGMRSRLRMVSNQGQTDFFVVHKPQAVAEEIKRWWQHA